MIKFSVISAPDINIEFKHYDFDAEVGHWKKQTEIYNPNIKINLFVAGDFTLLIGNSVYRPVYGDMCVMFPMELHRAHVYKRTHIEYYQLDISPNALDFISGGRELLDRLISSGGEKYYRPDKNALSAIYSLFSEIEAAAKNGESPLAFAHCLRLITHISKMQKNRSDEAATELSRLTRAVIGKIESDYTEDITLKSISLEFGASPSYLSRIFRREVGIGIHEYLTDYRISQATKLLADHSVTDTCYLCGFSDASHFISVFRCHIGMTPKEYKTLHT